MLAVRAPCPVSRRCMKARILALAAFSSSALSCLGHTAQLAIQAHAQPLDGASGKGGPKLTPVCTFPPALEGKARERAGRPWER